MKTKQVIALICALLLLPGLLPVAFPARAAGGKLVAITFDDGPGKYTEQLLDGLKSRGAKATFFLVGSSISARLSTVKRMVAEGHQIGNHSYSHKELNKLSASGIAAELVPTENLLKQAGGNQTYYLRPPYGSHNATVCAGARGPVILWDVDTEDWKSRNETSVYNKIINETRDGSIVLLHDLYSTSVNAALRAIDTLKARGYEPVTVKELLRRRGITPKNGSVYHSAPNKGINLPAGDPPKAPTLSTANIYGGKRITLSCATKGATLYYTLDGSAPSDKSTKYTKPFTVTQTTTVRAVAYLDGYPGSERKTTLTLSKAAAPKIKWSAGTVTLTPASGTLIYYTLDKSTPTEKSAKYSGPLAVGKRLNIRVSASGSSDRIISYTFTKYGHILTDTPAEKWYFRPIGEAIERDIMKGVGKTEFAPEDGVTRAMFITALFRLSGDPASGLSTAFTDIPKNEWYTAAVAWGAGKGIVKGMTDKTFAPDTLITREQMCAMLHRYLKTIGHPTKTSPLPAFSDAADLSGWAKKDVTALYHLGIIEGMGDNTFAPRATATRAQCAKILVALDDLV